MVSPEIYERFEEEVKAITQYEKAWQRRLLPVMVRMLAGLTIFFFLASFVQLFYLHSRIEKAPSIELKDIGRTVVLKLPIPP